jgi:hypothetical protein
MNLFFLLPELYSNVIKLSSFVMSSRDAKLSFWAAELAAVVVAATQVVAVVVVATKVIAVVVAL